MLLRYISVWLSGVTLAGCVATHPTNPIDPFESFNRQSFQFNHDMDEFFFQPIATTYKKITPPIIRTGIYNFFNNLNELPTIANDALQLNLKQGLSDSWRFAFNSTIGLGGLIDIGSTIGLPKHTQDFGLTLARWGWKRSEYFVIPFLGPSTVRDTLGIPVDYEIFTVYPHIKMKYRYPLLSLNAISLRANLLGAEDVVETAALDPYVFFRDAYLQRRQALIEQNDLNILGNNTAQEQAAIKIDEQQSGDPLANTDNVSAKDPDAAILKQLDSNMPQ